MVNPYPGSVGKLVFKQTRTRTEDLDAGFRRTVIQQGVSQGKVKKPPLPALEPSSGRFGLLFFKTLDIEIGKLRRSLEFHLWGGVSGAVFRLRSPRFHP